MVMLTITFLQRIAVLGFAFKADTGDTRESAAITLIKDFQSERAFVNIYDPQVEEEQIWNDLSEASPLIPIESSMFLRGRFGLVLIAFIYRSQETGDHLPLCDRGVQERGSCCDRHGVERVFGD